MALAIPNELEKLRDGAKKFVDEFTIGQKTVVGVAFVAVIVAVVAFLHYSGQPTYSPLYTSLSAADASSITQKLSSENIPFILADNGTTVEVPQNDVYSERIALAEDGLPNQSSNVGLSIVDKESLTASSTEQAVDIQQGLQGELETTIEAMSGVQSAQVNLVLPSDDPLALNNSPAPSAAVMVTMQTGQTLTNDQVQAIVHLVASSTPGLDANDVTVTDSEGDLLAGPGASGQSLQNQNEQTQLYENGVTQQVQSLLTKVLGPDNSQVVVNATLDFDQSSEVINGLQQNNDGTVVEAPNQSNQQNENYSGSAPPPGGTAGAVTDTNGTPSENNNLTNDGVQQNFTIGKFTQKIDTAPGAVKNQDVAVVVNSRAIPKGVSQKQLLQVVSTAAGIQTTRGDKVTLAVVPFSNATQVAQNQATAEANAQKFHNELVDLLRVAGVLLAIAIVLFLMHRSSRKPEELEPEELPALEAGEDFFDMDDELMMGDEEADMADADNPYNLDLSEGIPHELETSSIGEFIENQPDEVARLLRAWMQETKLAPERQQQPV